MSTSATKRLIEPFVELAPAPMFLAGFFRSPPENYHTSEAVEIDIQRDAEDVAVAITDVSTGQRQNISGKYSNKEFKPPIFDEVATISAFKLLSRDPGENPFQSPAVQAKAIMRAYREFAKLQNKIRRAIELMSAQLFTTGTLGLVNKEGTVVYVLDFGPKTATHFPTVGVAWAADGSTGAPLTDLANLAASIRTYGRKDPNVLIFSDASYAKFIANAAVQKAISRDGLGVGQLAPEKRGKGATFQGFVWIGSYRFEMWTYNGSYAHPQTGTPTPYIAADKVVMLCQEARLDLTFGAIPVIAPPESRALQFLPPRIRDSEAGIDLSTYSWIEPNGKGLSVSAGTRPLTIPTEIDTFGCLDITP